MHIIAFQQVFLLVHVRWQGIFCAKSDNNRWYEKANNNRRGARRSSFVVRQVRFGATKPRAQPHKVLQRRSVGNSRQRICNSIARRFVRSSQLQLRRCRMRGNPHETARGVMRFCPFCSLFFYFFLIKKARYAQIIVQSGFCCVKCSHFLCFRLPKSLQCGMILSQTHKGSKS